MNKNPLNDRQILFVYHYVISKNATKSAKLAGYSKDYAETIGSRLCRNVKVRAEIDRRLGKLKKKLEVSAERVLEEYARLALYDPADLYDKEGKLLPVNELPEDTRRAIRGWDVDQHESSYIDGKGDTYRVDRHTSIKPRMADKRPALRDLGQHLDLFEPEDEEKKRPIEITVKIGGIKNGKNKGTGKPVV